MREGKASGNLLRAPDHLFARPVTTPQLLASALTVRYATANNLIARLVDTGVLAEMTGYRRNRRFAYRKYLDMFEEGAAAALVGTDGQAGAAGEEATANEGTRPESARQLETAGRVMQEDGDGLRKLAE